MSGPEPSRRRIGPLHAAEVGLALLVVVIVGMMIVPLPTPVLDLLLSTNLALAVLVLSVSLFLRDGLSFAAFPTLLLLSTLFRLALNVSSTRLILLQADAGRVIDAFGDFVVRGDYVVGAVVFVILTIIQFGVIARGAERVAEVGARFTLDAMPGKQLAIDAEQRAQGISAEAARTLRRRLDREAQFYGAMDGAMKFVKGDAIAAIVITTINLVAGIGIGTLSRGMSLAEAAQRYGLLTIGDGLTSQLPSLLISTSAGLVVTRVASEQREGGSLGKDLVTQLGEPRALWVASALCALLATVPGLPGWTFLLLAGLAAVGAVRGGRQRGQGSRGAQGEGVVLQLGTALHRDVSAAGGTNTLAAAGQRAAAALGLTSPSITAHADAAIDDRYCVMSIAGVALPARSMASAEAVADEVALQVTRNAAAWLSLDDLQQRLDELAQSHPTLLAHSVPKPFPVTRVAHVVRTLASEGVSLRWLLPTLECLTRLSPKATDDALVEAVRRELGPRITGHWVEDGSLRALRLSPDAEDALLDALVEDGEHTLLAIEPSLSGELVDAIASAARDDACPLLVRPSLRRPLRELLTARCPDLPVLAAHELAPDVTIETAAVVGP